VEVDGDVGSGQAFAEDMDLSLGVANSQSALSYEAPEQIGQQTHVTVSVVRASPFSNVPKADALRSVSDPQRILGVVSK
jgi:hypothetical protein